MLPFFQILSTTLLQGYAYPVMSFFFLFFLFEEPQTSASYCSTIQIVNYWLVLLFAFYRMKSPLSPPLFFTTGISLCQLSAWPNYAALVMVQLHVAEVIGKRIACCAFCHRLFHLDEVDGNTFGLPRHMDLQPHSIILLYFTKILWSDLLFFLWHTIQCQICVHGLVEVWK